MNKRKYISYKNLQIVVSKIKELINNAVSTKANTQHTHTISDITNLQTQLDSKANSSHGTHVSYSTTAPVMDGTANVGSASTVARSDHKHPTDTSRASKTEFDTHDSNTTKHITSTERTNWNAGHTHSQSSHAPSDAQKNQNAFSNVKVGSVTVVADTPTDTLTLIAGDNVTLTPDANGDSITISSKDTNTTYSANNGISLSGTTFSNSGVRSIATGGTNGTISVNTNGTSTNVAVKGLGSAAYTNSNAYDSAGTAQTKADTALTSAKTYTDNAVTKVKNDLLNGAGGAYDTLKELGDLIDDNTDAIDALKIVASGKADKSHTHTIANVTGLQSALDGKALSNHTHNYLSLSGGTLTSTSFGVLNITRSGSTNGASIGFSNGNGILGYIGMTAGANGGLLRYSADTNSSYTVLDSSNYTTYAAKASHNHSASNITSGTLSSDRLPTVPISKGGTGATTAASALVNLGITATSSELNKLDGVTATTAEINKLKGLTATTTELNYIDGVTSNIQTQLNGKSATNHTHNYAGSSSAGGNASAAVKLATARNIGKASFNGTANIDAQSICGYANCTGTTDANANKYTKFARVSLEGAYSQCVGTLLFTPNEGNNVSGELNYYLRNGSAITSTTINLYWQHLTNSNYEQSVVAVKVSDGVFDLYYKSLSSWDTMKIININCNNPDRITFVSNSGWVASVTAAATSSINSTVSYAKSSGTSTTATQLSTSAGSATQPVYFSGGKPVATTYTLGKSVPADAKFTDTNTWRGIQNNLTSSSTTDSLSAAQGTALKALVDGKAASNHTHSYLPLAGGTLTGAVTFANGTWNTVGDDAQLGDCNIAGCVGIKGKNANTGINFVPYSGSTAQKLTINGAGTMTITGTVASTFSGSLNGNATSATKLQTARTIALGTGVTGTATSFNGSSNITIPVTDIKEAYLSWGGKNFSSGYGCIDGAMIQDLSANRLAFAKATGVTIEYSRDSGTTWIDYGSSNVAKSSLFTSNGYAHLIGKADSTNKATSAYQLRVTLNASSGGVYTALNKFCLYVSTNGSSGTTCTIQIAKNSAPSTYTTIVNEQGIGGWSGYNIINVSPFTFGSNSDQYGNLRFIFKSTGGSTQYNGLQVMSIQGFGGVGWTAPSNMAKTGHIYSFDGNQNVTFPASITGTGALSMNRKSGTTVGNCSVALGYNNESSNQYTFAEGVDTKATDYAAHAEGDRTTASSSSAHAEGQSTVASGLQSHAEGRASTASGSTSHAEGMSTTASGTASHSEGISTTASGMYCHAEGTSTTAKGYYTHAEGEHTTASGSGTHAEGNRTTSSGTYSHAEGSSTNKAESITTSVYNPDIITAWGTNKFSLARGEASHVEGKDCIALENYSHAEGCETMATGLYGSHAEGNETVASGQASHAEGNETIASGLESHAEGNGCVASGSYSHAEGKSTTASGIYSHAQNLGTEASAFYSTAMGEYTKASSLAQTVMGKYNVEDTSDDYALIIGNGESDTERSDALKVAWDGSVYAGAYGGAYVKLDNYFNMYHQRSNTGDTWNIKNSGGSSKFSIGFENGNTSVAGTLKVTGATTTHSNITSTNSSASATDTRFIRTVNANNSVDIRTSTNAGLYHDASYGYGTAGWLICINKSGTITTNTTSDARLKDKICDLSETEACALLNNVNPIVYSYKADIEQDEKNVGFYAQDVRNVLIDNKIGYRSFLRIHDNDNEGEDICSLEHNEDNVTYGLDYAKFVPILWKGWQIQQKQIKALEARIAELERE